MRAHPPTGALSVIRKLRIYYRSPLPPPPIPLRCRHTPRLSPTSFLFFDIVRRRVEGGPIRELFRLLWVEIAMGHPATFQMMGKKKLRQGRVVGCSERGRTKLIIRALWLSRSPYHSFRTIVEIPHDDDR